MIKKWYIVFMLVAFCTATSAAPIRLLTDERSVGSGGSAQTDSFKLYYDDTPSENSHDIQSESGGSVRHPSNSFGLFDKSVGMALRTAHATLDGQGLQRSEINESGIRFSGVADVFGTADHDVNYFPNYTEEFVGLASGGTGSSIRWQFAVDATLPMELSMNYSAGREGEFNFSLTDSNGLPLIELLYGLYDSYSQTLTLAPGVYTLNASLSAGVYASGYDDSRGDRTTADFSLLAVPLPASAVLMMLGLATLSASRLKRSRVHLRIWS